MLASPVCAIQNLMQWSYPAVAKITSSSAGEDSLLVWLSALVWKLNQCYVRLFQRFCNNHMNLPPSLLGLLVNSCWITFGTWKTWFQCWIDCLKNDIWKNFSWTWFQSSWQVFHKFWLSSTIHMEMGKWQNDLQTHNFLLTATKTQMKWKCFCLHFSYLFGKFIWWSHATSKLTRICPLFFLQDLCIYLQC